MKIKNKSKLLLIFFFLGVIIPLQLSTVSVNGLTVLDTSTMEVSTTEVLPIGLVVVTVHALNHSVPIINLDVDFNATEGNFQGSGDTISALTNSSGYAVVTWIAPFVDFTNDSFVVTIASHFEYSGVVKDQVQLVTIKHWDTSFIDGSEFNDPSPIIFGATDEISFSVKDIFDVPMEGAQVTATETTANGTIVGVVGSTITGLTDANGIFKFDWIADDQGSAEIERSIQFEFFVEAGIDANLTFNEEFFVTQYDATALTVSITSPVEIESGITTLIDVSIFAGGDPAEDANITLSVDSGVFSNALDNILLTANDTGLAEVLYTAPTVTTNTTITIAGDATLLSLTGSGSVDILVYTIEREFEATIAFSKTQVKQNESLVVTVTVTDKDTTSIVAGATVSFLLELGVWDENDNALYSAPTNAQGVATATFDGSNTAMIFQIQKINVTATITKDNFAQFEIVGNFSLEKLPDQYTFTAVLSATTVTRGGTITITVDAKINGVAFANTTVHLFTQAGTFNDGTSDYRAKTDAQGNLVVTWDSSSLPELTEARPIFIEVDLVNSGLDKVLLSVTVNPVGGVPSSTSDEGGSGDDGLFSDPLVIGGVVGVVALVGVGAFALRRGS